MSEYKMPPKVADRTNVNVYELNDILNVLRNQPIKVDQSDKEDDDAQVTAG